MDHFCLRNAGSRYSKYADCGAEHQECHHATRIDERLHISGDRIKGSRCRHIVEKRVEQDKHKEHPKHFRSSLHEGCQPLCNSHPRCKRRDQGSRQHYHNCIRCPGLNRYSVNQHDKHRDSECPGSPFDLRRHLEIFRNCFVPAVRHLSFRKLLCPAGNKKCTYPYDKT